MKVAKSKPPHAIIPPEHLKTSSSIPTKFETLINPNASENNAFMNRTYRFNSSETEVPGAGQYYTPTSYVKQNQSSSAKGYTAMASSNKRWYEAPKPTFNPPGPGNYHATDFITENFRKHANRRIGTHQFVKPSTVSVLGRDKGEELGPGSYIDVFKATAVPHRPVSHSVFKSGTKRFKDDYVDEQENQNEMEDMNGGMGIARDQTGFTAERKYKVSNSKEKQLPSYNFRSKIYRSTVVGFDPLDDKDNLLKDVMGTPRHIGRTSTVPQNNEQKNTSVFANAGRIDRFGNSTKTLVRKIERKAPSPGPGSYMKMENAQKRMISSSFFMSSSERFNESLEDSVGPGLYNADKLTSKHFHTNRTNKWV